VEVKTADGGVLAGATGIATGMSHTAAVVGR
jgi:hypothetical protein